MSRIHSIQIGQVETLERVFEDEERSQTWRTAFRKRPIDTPVEVRTLGVDGDAQADRKHHGGPDKAVLLYASAHYEAWRGMYPNLSLGPGAFGENVTVDDMDEQDVCIGDIYAVGTLVLEVSQPRIPCWKISERWHESTLTQAVRTQGWTGWYARVKVEGRIGAGERLELVERPHPEWSIAQLNDHLFNRKPWCEQSVHALRDLKVLADGWKMVIPRPISS